MENHTNNKKKLIILVAIFCVICVAIAATLIIIMNQKPAKDTSSNPDATYVAPDAVGATEIHYTQNDGYTTMLNLYNSIDNDMSLDTVEKVATEAKLRIATNDNEHFTIVDQTNESIKFDIIIEDDVASIYNLEFSYNRNSLSGSIKEVQKSQFQHFDGKTTNEYETKADAIEDYLIKQ